MQQEDNSIITGKAVVVKVVLLFLLKVKAVMIRFVVKLLAVR
jgi:hypothetical protein